MTDGDGVDYCGSCEELLPGRIEEMLGHLVTKLDRLSRQIDQLAPRRDPQRDEAGATP